MVNGAHQTQSFAYAGDELTAETWYNTAGTATNTLTFSYDEDDELLKAGNNAGTYTFGYDGGNLVSQIDPNSVTMSFFYNEAGERTSISDSQAGSTTLTYDGGNLVSEAYQGMSTQLLAKFSYDQDQELLGVTRYADLAGATHVGSTGYSYDGGNLTSILHKNGTTTLGSYGYSYDQAGELTQEVDNGATTNYAYNGAGELTSAGSQAYSYDANGNKSGTGVTVGADNEAADGRDVELQL